MNVSLGHFHRINSQNRVISSPLIVFQESAINKRFKWRQTDWWNSTVLLQNVISYLRTIDSEALTALVIVSND